VSQKPKSEAAAAPKLFVANLKLTFPPHPKVVNIPKKRKRGGDGREAEKEKEKEKEKEERKSKK